MKQKIKKIIKYLIVSIFSVIVLLTFANFAQADNNLPQINVPDLKINIPFVTFSPVNCQEGQDCAIPWIGEYIVGVYKYIVYVMGIAAVVVLMIGGVRWLTAGGNSSAIEDAKGWITASLSGLVLALLSFVILQQINPNLTNFKPINISVTAVEKLLLSIQPLSVRLINNSSESLLMVIDVTFDVSVIAKFLFEGFIVPELK